MTWSSSEQEIVLDYRLLDFNQISASLSQDF